MGIAAVEGNGQRELLRAIAGVARPAAGSLSVSGPVSFIPEDRTGEALIAGFSVTETLVLSQGSRRHGCVVRGSTGRWPLNGLPN